jgi:hypothetical protein
MKALLKLEVLLGDNTNFFSVANFIIVETLSLHPNLDSTKSLDPDPQH